MFRIRKMEPANVRYGKHRVPLRELKQPGDVIKTYFPDTDLQLGEIVTVGQPRYDWPGKIVHRFADEPQYQNIQLCGHVENTGRGYYLIEVLSEI